MVGLLYQRQAAALKARIGEGDRKLGIGGRPDDLSLELGRARDSDALAVLLHRHAQRGLHSVAVGLAGDLQAIAIVPDSRPACAINNRALLGDVVDNWRVSPSRLALRLDSVALEALGCVPGAQGGQRLGVALSGLLLKPVGPRPPLEALVVLGLLLVVVLADSCQVGPQRGSDLGIQQLLG